MIDKNNIFVRKFKDANPFSEGFASVQIGDQWAFVNKDGEMEKERYDFALIYNEGLACVKIKDDWKHIDKKGNVVFLDREDSDIDFEDVIKYSDELMPRETEDGWVFVDKKGNVGKRVYDAAYRFSEGLAIVEIDNETFFVDKDENFMLKSKPEILEILDNNPYEFLNLPTILFKDEDFIKEALETTRIGIIDIVEKSTQENFKECENSIKDLCVDLKCKLHQELTVLEKRLFIRCAIEAY